MRSQDEAERGPHHRHPPDRLASHAYPSVSYWKTFPIASAEADPRASAGRRSSTTATTSASVDRRCGDDVFEDIGAHHHVAAVDEVDRLASAISTCIAAALEHDGIGIDFVNPVDGTPVFPTLGYGAQLLRPGEATRPFRQTASTLYIAMEGRGYTEVNGKRLEWGRNDIFVVPSFPRWFSRRVRIMYSMGPILEMPVANTIMLSLRLGSNASFSFGQSS